MILPAPLHCCRGEGLNLVGETDFNRQLCFQTSARHLTRSYLVSRQFVSNVAGLDPRSDWSDDALEGGWPMTTDENADARPMALWIAGPLFAASLTPGTVEAWSYGDEFQQGIVFASWLLLFVPWVNLVASGSLWSRGVIGVVGGLGTILIAMMWGMLGSQERMVAVIQVVGIGLVFLPSVTRWARRKTLARWSAVNV